jgi:hypothetical protein
MAEPLATPYELRERVRQKLLAQYPLHVPEEIERVLAGVCWHIAHVEDDEITTELRIQNTVEDLLLTEKIFSYVSEAFAEEKRVLNALERQAMQEVIMAWGAPKIPTVQLLIAVQEARGRVVDAFVNGM